SVTVQVKQSDPAVAIPVTESIDDRAVEAIGIDPKFEEPESDSIPGR
ncbi:MAG: hypothetical protein IBX56_13500, partial [Methylomicrobium sp.]|nr:hypothetical protein [Methylomicrobium sp.]